MSRAQQFLHPRFADDYSQKVLGYSSIIAYWPMDETSDTTARCLVNSAQNGSYVGVTLGQVVTDANGVSFVCPFFDGAIDYVNAWSSTFRDAFNGAEHTAAVWARVNGAANWIDDTYRMMVRLLVNTSNYSFLAKTSVDNIAQGSHRAGGGSVLNINVTISSVNWVHWAVTVSKSANEMKVYVNGTQQGLTQSGMGTWAGLLGATTTCIGSQDTTPTNPWHGWLAHCAIWDSALSATQIADLANAI